MKRGWSTLTCFFLQILTAIAVQYECLPYPVDSVCRIERISYQSGDQISFPTGYQQYHIKVSRSLKARSSKVTVFNDKLYEAMHKPTSIEMTNTEMDELMLPAELLVGDFSDNNLASVDALQEETYQITYLDVSFNRLHHMDFVGRLVNLEILHLERNAIGHVPGSQLSLLTKLKYLYLQFNSITWIPWSDIPRSMIHLDCYLNSVTDANFTDIDLPFLEYLNLQYNELSAINVTELLRTAPNLKEVHLYNNQIDRIQLRKIMTELTSNNISFVDLHNWCTADEEFNWDFDTCIQRQEESLVKIPIRQILLSITAVGSAALFVYILVLVYRHMQR
ncbi:leucine-rich repeat transmembrane neuronal protein 4 [Aedes albopictus]|uniref:Leucine-rich repeat protein n=1 Tax=Aedes albopictus TaxID=7160 RepID=A0ABM1Y089_AEDAL